jgi:hypothetical protein
MKKDTEAVERDVREELSVVTKRAITDIEQLIGFDYRVQNRVVTLHNDARHILGESIKRLQAIYQHGFDLAPRPAPSQPISVSVEELRRQLKRPKSPAEWWTGKPCEICGEHRTTNVCHILPRSLRGWLVPDNLFVLCPTHHFLFDHSRLSRDEFAKLDVSTKAKDAQRYFEKALAPRQQMFWRYGIKRGERCYRCKGTDFGYSAHRTRDGLEIRLTCQQCVSGTSYYDFHLVDFHPLRGLSATSVELIARGGTSEDEAAEEIDRRLQRANEWIASWDGSDLF